MNTFRRSSTYIFLHLSLGKIFFVFCTVRIHLVKDISLLDFVLVHAQQMLDLVVETVQQKGLHGIFVILINELSHSISECVLREYCERLSFKEFLDQLFDSSGTESHLLQNRGIWKLGIVLQGTWDCVNLCTLVRLKKPYD